MNCVLQPQKGEGRGIQRISVGQNYVTVASALILIPLLHRLHLVLSVPPQAYRTSAYCNLHLPQKGNDTSKLEIS